MNEGRGPDPDGRGRDRPVRTLLSRPGVDPALAVDADLRPEGKGGALIRSLAAYRNYYQRWSSTWDCRRSCALTPSAATGRSARA